MKQLGKHFHETVENQVTVQHRRADLTRTSVLTTLVPLAMSATATITCSNRERGLSPSNPIFPAGSSTSYFLGRTGRKKEIT